MVKIPARIVTAGVTNFEKKEKVGFDFFLSSVISNVKLLLAVVLTFDVALGFRIPRHIQYH